MELEEDTHHNEDNEGRVVSVAPTGQLAVVTPELLSHAPRAEDAKHEAGKDTAKVYVGKGFADAICAFSGNFSHFNQYSVFSFLRLAAVFSGILHVLLSALEVKRHVDIADQQDEPHAHRRQSQEEGVSSGSAPVSHDQESSQELDSQDDTNDVDGPAGINATDFAE